MISLTTYKFFFFNRRVGSLPLSVEPDAPLAEGEK